MARLLILLALPAHVCTRDAEAWLQAGLRAVAASDDVKGARLSRVQPGSRRFPPTWDRLLELELADGVEPGGWADDGACGDWLWDMRSLGVRPAVLVADGTTAIAVEQAT